MANAGMRFSKTERINATPINRGRKNRLNQPGSRFGMTWINREKQCSDEPSKRRVTQERDNRNQLERGTNRNGTEVETEHAGS